MVHVLFKVELIIFKVELIYVGQSKGTKSNQFPNLPAHTS